jgi:hypothetical protein
VFVADELDFIAQHGLALGFKLRDRTIWVEGTSDADLFQMAARLEWETTGHQLMGDQLAIIAPGIGNSGGTRGVIRELMCYRGMARTCFLPNGDRQYRFIGLFDNDSAGKQAVRAAGQFDASILEFRDVFRLWPSMPRAGTLDPKGLESAFHKENQIYKGLDWELEDLLMPDFLRSFHSELPRAISRVFTVNDRSHYEFAQDGKSQFHRYIRENAVHADLVNVIETLRSLRYYLGLK